MDPYCGEIRLFAGNFAPQDWAWCNGQSLPVNQFQELFAVIQNTYGGDGVTTFNLPNFAPIDVPLGLVPLGAGQGPGLEPRPFASSGGSATATLDDSTMPPHDHVLQATTNTAGQTSPVGAIWAKPPGVGRATIPAYDNNPADATSPLAPTAVTPYAGGGNPHNNLQPFVNIGYIISLLGTYPLPPDDPS